MKIKSKAVFLAFTLKIKPHKCEAFIWFI